MNSMTLETPINNLYLKTENTNLNNASLNDCGQNCLGLVQTYYPTYYSYWQPNKTEQAFRLVQKLLQKKLVKLSTIKDFIELTNEIVAIL